MSQLAKRAIGPRPLHCQLLQKSSRNSRWFLKSPESKSTSRSTQSKTWLQSSLFRIPNPTSIPFGSINTKISTSQLQLRLCNPNILIRGLRNGTGKGGIVKESLKSRRQFLLTALQDSGSKLSDRVQIFRPVLFTAFVAGTAFVGSTIWQYENYKHSIARDAEYLYGLLQRKTRSQNKRFSIRDQIHSIWDNASTADKIFWPICIMNGLVFLAWRIPSLTTFMVTYFTATPVSRAVCLPMVLSTFSHYSFFHFAANMFVLHSFLPAATSLLGKENFVGLYFTAGAVSSLGSHLHKIFIGSNIPSLGASGAIMGILALVCTRMPDIQLGIIFIPGLVFSASTAMKCILTVDTVGLLAGWKFMDHAAHLSGACIGIAYAYFEQSLFPLRESIVKSWHNYRTG